MLSHRTNVNISVQKKKKKMWIQLNLLGLVQCIAHSPNRDLVLVQKEKFTQILLVKGMAMGNSRVCVCVWACVLNR